MLLTKKSFWSSLFIAALGLAGTIASAGTKCVCTACWFQSKSVGNAIVNTGNDDTTCKDLNNNGAEAHRSGSTKQKDQGWLVCSSCSTYSGSVGSDYTYDN